MLIASLIFGLIIAYLAISSHNKSTFRAKFEQIKTGDSELHIVELLGDPPMMCSSGAIKYYDYTFGGDHFNVQFTGDPSAANGNYVVSKKEVSNASLCGEYHPSALNYLEGIASIILLISSFGTFTCLIIVLIKLFQNEGAGLGMLGFFCGFYTYVWGWQNSRRLNIRGVMWIWTVLFILGCLASAVLRR
ncbi:MAG: hypothetical protein M3247_05570 [Thermoproteota archaeon]|nr:hypothetical protein [Acidobacteriota bacterium]MDQ3903088.1 hypothetical protein [Thermoproteota archaeon]